MTLRGLVPAVLLASAVLATPASAADRWFTVPVSGPGDAAAGFLGGAADGSRVYFVTSEALLPEDADSSVDIYSREGAKLTLVSGPAPGAQDSGAGSLSTRGASADGSTVVFQTNDSLSPDDTNDGEVDLYEHSGGVTRLVSKPDPSLPPAFSFPFYSPLVRISADGRFVAFQTDKKLSPADNDNAQDVYLYERDSGTATLASPGGLPFGDVSLSRLGGDHVYMETTQTLLAADTDSASDVYRFDASTGKLTLATPGTAETPIVSGTSADGTHLYYRTDESVTGDDTDGGERDVYQYTNGQTALISVADGFPQGPNSADFQRASADGSIVFFTTAEQLTADDTDGGTDDIYTRSADGVVRLISTGPAETLTGFNAIFSDISADGSRAYFYTAQDLTADDTDGGFTDAFERSGGVTTRISVGEQNDQGFADSSFAGFSQDATRLFFATEGQFTADDSDDFDDIYERHAGSTSLVTAAAAPCTLLPSPRCSPEYHGVSTDGHRVWLQSDEVLSRFDSEDGGATDVYESRLAVPGTVSETLEVSDPYDDVFGATVHVSGFQAGDELSYSGAIPGVISGDTLTLTGRGTDADYQAALRAVSFTAGSVPGTRTVEYSVDNGAGAGPPARRSVVVPAEAAPPATEPPVTEPPPAPPLAGPPSLLINDTGVWIAHLRPQRVFRVPGLVFYCPKAATASCTATVTVGKAAGGSVTVPPSQTRGIRLRLTRRGARTVARRGRLRLTARASYTLSGSDPAAAVIKRFIILR